MFFDQTVDTNPIGVIVATHNENGAGTMDMNQHKIKMLNKAIAAYCRMLRGRLSAADRVAVQATVDKFSAERDALRA